MLITAQSTLLITAASDDSTSKAAGIVDFALGVGAIVLAYLIIQPKKGSHQWAAVGAGVAGALVGQALGYLLTANAESAGQIFFTFAVCMAGTAAVVALLVRSLLNKSGSEAGK
ncbi:hypothetical protein [Mycolicibacterium sp. S3B2]|uniref:hypothetical protein n=1 Tax=Mycolicibacterium sp. S3B2 TaxID=3415120 RepID=UPI003C7DE942